MLELDCSGTVASLSEGCYAVRTVSGSASWYSVVQRRIMGNSDGEDGTKTFGDGHNKGLVITESVKYEG